MSHEHEMRISMLEHHVQKLLAENADDAASDDQLEQRIAALERWKDNCASFATPPAPTLKAPLNAMENTPTTADLKLLVHESRAQLTPDSPEPRESRTRRLARECGHEHSAPVISALERMAHEVAAEKDKEIQSLKAQLGNACDLAKHWKANHDNAVKIKRELLERPDLKMERLREELAAERHTRERLEVELTQMKDDLTAARKIIDEADKQLASLHTAVLRAKQERDNTQALLMGAHGREYCTGLENRLAEAKKENARLRQQEYHRDVLPVIAERDKALAELAAMTERAEKAEKSLTDAGFNPDLYANAACAERDAARADADALRAEVAALKKLSIEAESKYTRLLHAAKHTCESLVMPRMDSQDICGLRELRDAVRACCVEVES